MKSATVIKCNKDIALIKTLPKSSPCDTCKSPCAQRSCEQLKPIKLWAKNTVNASVGEEVLVEEAKTGAGIFSAVCCMLVPLICAVFSFVLTRSIVTEGISFLISLAVFVVAEICGVPMAKAYEKKHPTLNIVKNLENN